MEILQILKETYPNAHCTLDYKNPLHLVIATILAAQCTDARVNLVVPALFERFNTAYDFAEASEDEVIKYIKSTGFFRNKAKNIISCCKRIVEEYGGKVPDNMNDLLTLSGVGRKTANVILGEIYDKPAVVVDTHAGRLARRIGLTKNTNPTKVESDLRALLPPEESFLFCHLLVYHGRKICTARKPKCHECSINELCQKNI